MTVFERPTGLSGSPEVRQTIETAIRDNPACAFGLALRPVVIHTLAGPSGGDEILALIHANGAGDDHVGWTELEPNRFFGFWHVHFMPNPHDPSQNLAFLAHSTRLVNALTPHVYLTRFHNWMRHFNEHHAALVLNKSDGIMRGVEAICALVSLFSPHKVWPDDYLLPAYSLQNSPMAIPYGLPVVDDSGHYRAFEIATHQADDVANAETQI